MSEGVKGVKERREVVARTSADVTRSSIERASRRSAAAVAESGCRMAVARISDATCNGSNAEDAGWDAMKSSQQGAEV